MQSLYLNASTDGWYLVRTPAGIYGWIKTSLVVRALSTSRTPGTNEPPKIPLALDVQTKRSAAERDGWTWVADSQDGLATYVYHPATVERVGALWHVWARSLGAYGENKTLFAIGCETRQFRILNIINLDNKGTVHANVKTETFSEPERIPPGSVMYALAGHVCKKDVVVYH